MYAEKNATAAFTQPSATVLETVKSLAGQKPFTTTSVDDAQGRVTFTRGKTALSWGAEYVVDVTGTDQGAEVSVTAGGIDGAPRALLDGKKHAKAARQFLDEVSKALAGR